MPKFYERNRHPVFADRFVPSLENLGTVLLHIFFSSFNLPEGERRKPSHQEEVIENMQDACIATEEPFFMVIYCRQAGFLPIFDRMGRHFEL